MFIAGVIGSGQPPATSSAIASALSFLVLGALLAADVQIPAAVLSVLAAVVAVHKGLNGAETGS
jgi:hydrogenase/urease accessory protein HupE